MSEGAAWVRAGGPRRARVIVEGRAVRRLGYVVLILLLAFGLRMARLQDRPLWYDEAFALLYASSSPAQMVYGTLTPVEGAGAADVHPLLYYFLLHAWMGLVGRSPLAARFLSVGFGMVTVALLGRLADWCFDRRTGMAAGLLAAVNPFHVAYSQEARMYALLGLAAVTATSGLLRALEEDETEKIGGTAGKRRGDRPPCSACHLCICHLLIHPCSWALYAIGAAVTLYAHNLGAFVLLALHLLAFARRRWWPRLPSLLLADLVALALFSPWLVGVLPGQMGFVGRGYWLTPPGVEELVRALMLPVLTFYEPAPVWLLGLGLFTGLLVLVLLLLRTWRTRARSGWFLLLCWMPVLGLMLTSRWRPIYLERALLPSALLYLLAVGWLLVRGGLPRPLRLGVMGLLIVTVAASLGVHYTYVGFPRPPFQEATDYLQDYARSGDPVVHTNKLTFFPMHLYAADLGGVFLADPHGSPQDTLAYPTQEALGIFATSTITEAVGQAQQVWIVYFPREVEEVQAMGVAHPALDWLEHRFALVEQQCFGDLVVALYRREVP